MEKCQLFMEKKRLGSFYDKTRIAFTIYSVIYFFTFFTKNSIITIV